MPLFEYRVYGQPTAPGDDLWDRPLPQDRRGAAASDGTAPFTHGAYFRAARAFLEGEAQPVLRAALNDASGKAVPGEAMGPVCIDLKKHGAFYHPAKVTAAGASGALVLNVAVSGAGRALLEKECDCLDRIQGRGPTPAVPRVYASGTIPTKHDRPVSLFLGEWFSGYREFHLSEDEAGARRMIVWDDPKGRYFLTPEETAGLYRGAAEILTDLYDAETFEQVHPWHHGAGDFVAKPGGGSVPVKLVTVRGYGTAMARPDSGDPASLLQALLLFLLNLSIWTRLDRLDGVGEVVWSDDRAVAATVAGFFDALERKPTPAVLPEPLALCFRAFLSVCSPGDLMAVADSLVAAYPDNAPEVPVIRAHLSSHLRDLHRALDARI